MADSFLLLKSGGYLLLKTGGRIILELGTTPAASARAKGSGKLDPSEPPPLTRNEYIRQQEEREREAAKVIAADDAEIMEVINRFMEAADL